MMKAWGQAMQDGDRDGLADSYIEQMTPILTSTQWFSNYRGLVQGALKSACQDGATNSCVAVCIVGGPVTRVECWVRKFGSEANFRPCEIALPKRGVRARAFSAVTRKSRPRSRKR